MQPLILASGSRYRESLLRRLGLDFTAHAADIDETPRSHEPPETLAQRLASSKAHALATQHPNALIIGSDQVAWLDGEPLHKPGNFDNALAQLQRSRGKTVTFYTGLCLYDGATATQQLAVERYRASFRALTDAQLRQYLTREQPYDCAGSFKCEGLGISLFTSLSGNDPTALIGLPLIRLTDMLTNAGLAPLGHT